MKKAALFVWDLVKIVVISAIIIVPIRLYVMQPFFVRGDSMEPNFHNGEYLIVDEISYRFHEPQRGDVIIFKYPNDPKQFYIKRIIGLPSEKVIVNEGKVTVCKNPLDDESCKKLDESAYFPFEVYTNRDNEMTLENEEYYVIGDNRKNSSDSREWGILQKKYIVGRAWVRAFPFDRLTIFETPAYAF